MDYQLTEFLSFPLPGSLPATHPQFEDPMPERETEGMNDLFALIVDEDQLASDGLEALFDIPTRERGKEKSTRGHTPETTPGLSAGQSTAAQTPCDRSDLDGGDDSHGAEHAVQDADAGATPRAHEGRAETSHSRRQTAPASLDLPLDRVAQSPPATGPEALPAATGCRKRRADDGDQEAELAREAPKRQRVGASIRHAASATLQHGPILSDNTVVPAQSHIPKVEDCHVFEHAADVDMTIPLPTVGPLRAPDGQVHGESVQTTQSHVHVDVGEDDQSEGDNPDVDLSRAAGSAFATARHVLPFEAVDYDDFEDGDEAALEDNTPPPPVRKSTAQEKKKPAQRRTKKTSDASVAGQNAQKHDNKPTRPYFAYKALWEERKPQLKELAEAIRALPPHTPVSELPGKKTLSDEDKELLKQLGPQAKGRIIQDAGDDYVTCQKCVEAFCLDDERIRNVDSALKRHDKEYHSDAACSACGMPIAGRDTKHFRMHRQECEPFHALVERGCHWEWMLHHGLVNPRMTKAEKGDEFFDSKQKGASKHAGDAYAALRDMFKEREVKAIRKALGLLDDDNA